MPFLPEGRCWFDAQRPAPPSLVILEWTCDKSDGDSRTDSNEGYSSMVKPDPRIFQYFCERFGLIPEQIIYIDDLQHNVEAASRIGMQAIRFSDSASRREELVQLGLLRSKARLEHVAAVKDS